MCSVPSGFSFTLPLICTAKTFAIEYSFFSVVTFRPHWWRRAQPPRFTGNESEPQGDQSICPRSYNITSCPTEVRCVMAQGKSFSHPVRAECKQGAVENSKGQGDTAVTFQRLYVPGGHGVCYTQTPLLTHPEMSMRCAQSSAERG